MTNDEVWDHIIDSMTTAMSRVPVEHDGSSERTRAEEGLKAFMNIVDTLSNKERFQLELAIEERCKQ